MTMKGSFISQIAKSKKKLNTKIKEKHRQMHGYTKHKRTNKIDKHKAETRTETHLEIVGDISEFLLGFL